MAEYDDIIHLPHHVSEKRKKMTMVDRAAQFSPFAALTGYEAQIRETARLTDAKNLLSDEEKTLINDTLSILNQNLSRHPEITVTFFREDNKKAGGAYVTLSSRLRKIDTVRRSVTLFDGTEIFMENIKEIRETGEKD